tara:strand:- start:1156 stop:2664 length:1509 start_codon:yes stop_codon:yes gene_type:complete
MFKLFGPPGTGKTTALLDLVDKALRDGTPPNKIAFLAFTRKAAQEAKDRASERFFLDKKTDLANFRTLHSFALSRTAIPASQIMSEKHYFELGQRIGVKLGRTKNIDLFEDGGDFSPSADPILALINLARLRRVSLRAEYNASDLSVEWNTVKYVSTALDRYKRGMHLYDFTDMLEEFVANASTACPHLDLCLLDEAQDLSALQWELAHALDLRAKRMFVAGDDDQAIYSFAGASVEHFLSLDAPAETLSQSYRVPRAVHELAEKVVARIPHRFPKKYLPRSDKGSVQRVSDVSQVNMTHGSWLILAQAGYMLQTCALELRAIGLLFNFCGQRSIPAAVSEAVNAWERCRKGLEITGLQARAIYRFMSPSRIKAGHKRVKGLSDTACTDYEGLVKNHGLVAQRNMIWSTAMDKLLERDRAYVTAMLRRGESFNAAPRIDVSTIHAAKGGEADNVVVLTDLSPAADTTEGQPDIHRLFYVAFTRCKQNLFLVEADNFNRAYVV